MSNSKRIMNAWFDEFNQVDRNVNTDGSDNPKNRN